jgi:hypothetical protein
MYAELMLRCAADIAARGPVWDLMRDHAGPRGSVPPLRLLGAVHRLVLTGAVPDLARYYPSAGGTWDPGAAWPAFLGVVTERAADLVPYLDRTVQTNEVGRAAALLGGFHAVARATGRPLRLLEVGASGGLLLRWDAFRYVLPGAAWGPAGSPVVLDTFATPVPLWPATAVAERRGCDRAPIDPASDEGRLTLLSYVWPDQRERFDRLCAALAVAERVPAVVDAADAVAWTRERLAEDPGDAVPVVYHSVVMQYLAPDAREEFESVVRAGEAPRAWLRFEPEGEEFVVRLTTWPGGEERLLARAHPHGYDVTWLTT